MLLMSALDRRQSNAARANASRAVSLYRIFEAEGEREGGIRFHDLMSRHRDAGFSLVELMCAILILGVGLVGLTQGITTALSSNKESELQTTAALIAAGRIETLRAEGYLMEGEDEGDSEEGLALYHWRQTITRGKIDGLYDVAVVV